MVDKDIILEVANRHPNVIAYLDVNVIEEFLDIDGFVEGLESYTLESLVMSQKFVAKLRVLEPEQIAKVASVPNLLMNLSDDALKVILNWRVILNFLY